MSWLFALAENFWHNYCPKDERSDIDCNYLTTKGVKTPET